MAIGVCVRQDRRQLCYKKSRGSQNRMYQVLDVRQLRWRMAKRKKRRYATCFAEITLQSRDFIPASLMQKIENIPKILIYYLLYSSVSVFEEY